jgi:hypothetical protein
MREYINKFALLIALGIPITIAAFGAKASRAPADSPRIYIEPQNGFESYISAAIIKKQVPALVTLNKADAKFVLTSVVLQEKETTGGKIARCLFLYCAGIAGIQTATVQLINPANQQVVWAYNVRKGSASAYQSTAEAIAKHLKEFLEKRSQ